MEKEQNLQRKRLSIINENKKGLTFINRKISEDVDK